MNQNQSLNSKSTRKTDNEPSLIVIYKSYTLGESHSKPTIEMTSSSPDNSHNTNCDVTPKVVGLTKLPYTAVTQQPQSPRNRDQGIKSYNRQQAVLGDFESEDKNRYWSSGLFSCFDDWSSCFLGFLCPCCLAGIISCSLNECCCTATCYPVATRTKIRSDYNIVGTICEDAYIICWCYQCALCQMSREIDSVNLDH